MKAHMRTHKERVEVQEVKEVHACSCGYKTTDTELFRTHKRTHDENHACTVCDFSCSTKHGIVMHERTHLLKYYCQRCLFKCAEQAELDLHKKKHLDVLLPCPECKYSTYAPVDFSMHRRTHMGEMPYLCGECGFRARQKHELAAHKRTHLVD
jgi:hypothetical protein